MGRAEGYELSIVMPCLNESATIGRCIQKALAFLAQSKVKGEVIVADNGSQDGSVEIAGRLGAKVVNIEDKGYGSALMGGIEAAKGKFVIMGDSDDSYDFTDLAPFLEKLREGFDLVVGNRFMGGIEPGSMPFLHRYLGNPILSFLGNLFFHSGIGDFHCGLRGFNKQSIEALDLKTTGMEFASEMIVKASLQRLRITEVPTLLSRDGRNRPSHLRTWRDGWRHLRFLLIYSPKWLFFYPGSMLAICSLLLLLILEFTQLHIGKIVFDIHTMLYAAFGCLTGVQAVLFYAFSKEYAYSAGILSRKQESPPFILRISLESGLILGVILFAAGCAGSIYSIFLWQSTNFSSLDPEKFMRIVIPSALLIALGIQLFFSFFLMDILRIHRK